MKPTNRLAVSALIASALSLGVVLPASAQEVVAPGDGVVEGSPADPTTVDELLSSPGYTESHADVLRLYRAFFDREPDIEGALYWMGVYDDGASLDDIAWGFTFSEEFIAQYGDALTNADFLDVVYGNVLDRDPDEDGLAYWLDLMDDGLSQSGVVRWVAANEEFITSYPYADGLADVSTILPTLDDAAVGWVAQDSASPLPADAECVAAFAFPAHAATVQLAADADNGPFVSAAAYAYPTIAQAEAFMDALAMSLDDCPSTVTSDDWTLEINAMSFDEIDDETVAINRRFEDSAASVTRESELVFVRYGSTIIAVDHSAVDNVDSTMTEEFVALIVDRLVTLVG